MVDLPADTAIARVLDVQHLIWRRRILFPQVYKVARSLRYTSPTPNISCTAMPLFQVTMCESPFLPKRWTLESPEAFKSRPS